jgi:hypothetical protein
MLPIVALNAYVYRPAIARRANVDGFVLGNDAAAPTSDD